MSSIGFYDTNADVFFQGSVDADMETARQAFAALLKPGGEILDAGCGSGRDALAFHQMGFAVTAIEASAPLAALARAHIGLPVQVLRFEEVAWRQAFDGIWACASLLHVPRADLPATVGRLRDALKPSGVIWMSFKYGAGERQVAGRRFTDMDEADGDRLIVETGGLSLVSRQITDDARQDRPGERWLSLTCRRA